jgi:hypothetical protein
MESFLLIFILAQEATKTEHDIGEEVIKAEREAQILETKIYLEPRFEQFSPFDSILAQERYLFDEKLYTTIDLLNTPILYLHSEYLRVPIVSRLMYGGIALFIPKFEKTVSSWELVITDAQGQVKRRYADRGLPPASITWDGRTDSGEMCNMGEVYNYLFSAFDAIGNPTRIGGRSYAFNGIVYDEKETKIVSIAAKVLFLNDSPNLATDAPGYLDEVTNLIKENFQKEVVVYSYSAIEDLAKARGQIILDELVKRTVLPKAAIKTAPRFIPGLQPKYSKIEIVIR